MLSNPVRERREVLSVATSRRILHAPPRVAPRCVVEVDLDTEVIPSDPRAGSPSSGAGFVRQGGRLVGVVDAQAVVELVFNQPAASNVTIDAAVRRARSTARDPTAHRAS